MDIKRVRRWVLLFWLAALSVALVSCIDVSSGGGGGGLLGSLDDSNRPARARGGWLDEGGHGERKGFDLPLERWANRDYGDRERGRTALHEAAEGGHERRCKELIKDGAEVNARDRDGRTPLHVAAKRGHMDVVEVLLKHGANVWVRDKKGKRASTLANDKGNKTVSRYLGRKERRR